MPTSMELNLWKDKKEMQELLPDKKEMQELLP